MKIYLPDKSGGLIRKSIFSLPVRIVLKPISLKILWLSVYYGGNIMRRTIFKTICLFTLVFFVMSMTGAAACSGASCKKADSRCKTDARNDTFKVDLCKKSNCFNVLKNDKGCGLKVISTGYINTAQGGKVLMQKNGKFCYVKPVSCSKNTDSFTYTAVNKYGQRDTAKVTLNFKCTDCSKSCKKCASICAKCPTCPSCTSCKC
jgi:hypothetical protein